MKIHWHISEPFFTVFIIYLFGDRFSYLPLNSLRSLQWPWTFDSPALISWVLGLQTCTITLSFELGALCAVHKHTYPAPPPSWTSQHDMFSESVFPINSKFPHVRYGIFFLPSFWNIPVVLEIQLALMWTVIKWFGTKTMYKHIVSGTISISA